jgi:hypothetical protein
VIIWRAGSSHVGHCILFLIYNLVLDILRLLYTWVCNGIKTYIYIYISVCVCVCLSAFLVAYDENVHHKYLNDLGLSIM